MKNLLLILTIIFLVGCAEQLPDDKKEFVGLWKSNQTSLLITESGRLEYETQKGSTKNSISMPIKNINESEIVAGFLFIKSTFELQGKPIKEDDLLTLVVDGEKLFKTDELGRLPQATNVPELEVLRPLVTNELNLLSEAINKSDFSTYIDNASLLYQSQFTNEKMVEMFTPFMEQKIDLEHWMSGDFILTEEPSIDENGVLHLNGKYPTSPQSLKFSLSFIYSHPNWKSLGPDININDK